MMIGIAQFLVGVGRGIFVDKGEIKMTCRIAGHRNHLRRRGGQVLCIAKLDHTKAGNINAFFLVGICVIPMIDIGFVLLGGNLKTHRIRIRVFLKLRKACGFFGILG